MSLSALLDVAPAHDFLRGLLSLTQEFEAVPEDRYGGKNVRRPPRLRLVHTVRST